MAKRATSSAGSPAPREPDRPTNERGGSASPSGFKLEDLAIPAYNLVKDAENRTNKVTKFEQEITLEQAEALMRQVQASQRGYTEGLNRLSSYRKVVARILETRRREAASLRKKATSDSSSSPPEVKDPDTLKEVIPPLEDQE